MRSILRVLSGIWFLFSWTSSVAAGCDHLPAGQTFWVRLTNPVSSFESKPGSHVRAIVYESPQCEGIPVFPLGTLVDGVVKSVRSVGLGFHHETARLELQFGQLLSGSDPPVPFSARVIEVSNARESVKNGVIQGIQSTNTPQGRITSRLKHLPAWNPYTDWVLLAYRLTFPVSPEPEIYFPPGTDLRLQLLAPVPFGHLPAAGPQNPDFTPFDGLLVDKLVAASAERTTTTRGREADVVNLVFIGSRQQIESAFQAAGWMSSDPVSKRSVLRVFHAFLALDSYPRAPISKQLFEGQPSDSAWEKSLNSYGKREHLRIWAAHQTWQERQVWMSASSRETGATLSFGHLRFLHHVDSNLDAERDNVVRDLTLAGCVEAVHESSRLSGPEFSWNATGDPLRTGGGVAVVSLRDCTSPIFVALEAGPAHPHPGNKFTRYVRMQVLGVRSDMWRSNIIYGGYDVGRMSISALRRRNSTSSKTAQTPAAGRP